MSLSITPSVTGRVVIGFSLPLLLVTLVMGLPILQVQAQPLETPRPLDVFLLLDQSEGMRWVDPENIRLEAARYFTKYLAAFYTDIFDHHLGLINFGTTAPAEKMVPLTPLDRQAISSIERKIVPLDLGYTSFINALQVAAQSFASGAEGRKRAVVIFTDGRPNDRRELTTEAYFKEIEEFVAKNIAEVSLYVIAVGAEGKSWSLDKQFWEEITRGRVFELRAVDEVELEKIYNTIVFQLLRISELHWDQVPEEGLEIKIEPYLDKVAFSVLKENPEVEFSLIRDDGEKVRPGDPDVTYYSSGRLFEIYAISEPSAGIWRYTITRGRGRVEVGKALTRVEVKLVQPFSPHPQGKNMELLASFRKRDGSPIKELATYPLWIGARVIKPGGTEVLVEFEKIEEGLYQGKEIIQSDEAGQYLVTLTVKAGTLILPELQVPIEVKPLPYLEVVSPRGGADYILGEPLEIEVQLRQAGRPAKAQELFLDDPRSLIWVTLMDAQGELVDTIRLSEDPQRGVGVFVVQTDLPRKEESYSLTAYLAGTLTSGERYKAWPEVVSFRIEKGWLSKVSERWPWFAGLLAPGGLIYFLYWQRLPVLNGMIQVQKGNDILGEHILTGRRKLKVRAGKGYPIPLPPDDPKKQRVVAKIRGKRSENANGSIEVLPLVEYQEGEKSDSFTTRELDDGESIVVMDDYVLTYHRRLKPPVRLVRVL
ncbi:hypothetical protein HKBW3S44_01284 [Candidatus Hakubella thermalkaliphila]|uniref:VWFA domain-containing protein n=1 Tax=Candidatus Hakubella thermalkaliphila TaxID=2754717 RepID=A0A6V8PYN9_9ACTN|nr:vWA domain-containing protein [Candidatus Hakubella thermalkaliphila]GFP37608.1 hypothetical protein HKBW3S44_01284 [Candidatus Hakubella thermalkaliphila]